MTIIYHKKINNIKKDLISSFRIAGKFKSNKDKKLEEKENKPSIKINDNTELLGDFMKKKKELDNKILNNIGNNNNKRQ